MHNAKELAAEHVAVTRRYFLQLGAAGVAALQLSPVLSLADEASAKAALAEALAKREYLTRPNDFRLIERGEPLPYTHPIEKLQEVGMTHETWKLEVVSDPDAKATIGNPLSKELGTALDWPALMKLAETKAVKYLKVMSCNNIDNPLGMGLWEGVPLRDVIWLTKPTENIRRVFYYGYHNDTLAPTDFPQFAADRSRARRSARRESGHAVLQTQRRVIDRKARRTGADARTRRLRIQVGEMADSGGPHECPVRERHLR